MPEEEIVVAKIVGEELRVERYGLQQRSESSFPCPGGQASTGDRLEEVVRRVRPHLLMWTARDPRGRRLAEALQKTDDETQWRPGEGHLPGCVEVERWTDVPLSEVLRLMRRVGSEEAGRPAEVEGRLPAEREAEGGQTIQRPPAPERAPARWEREARAHSADLPGDTAPLKLRSAEQRGHLPNEARLPDERWEELGDRLELVLAARAKRGTDGQAGK